MKPVAVPAGKIGQFYSGDCYIVFYSYRENAGHGKEVQIVYYWIVSLIRYNIWPYQDFDFISIDKQREDK